MCAAMSGDLTTLRTVFLDSDESEPSPSASSSSPSHSSNDSVSTESSSSSAEQPQHQPDESSSPQAPTPFSKSPFTPTALLNGKPILNSDLPPLTDRPAPSLLTAVDIDGRCVLHYALAACGAGLDYGCIRYLLQWPLTALWQQPAGSKVCSNEENSALASKSVALCQSELHQFGQF